MKTTSRPIWLRGWLPLATAVLLVAFYLSKSGAQTANPPAKPLPADVAGAWQVKSVLVDMEATRTLQYERNDSRLVGRRFTFSAGAIESNGPEAQACSMPTVVPRRVTARKLIETNFAGHGDPVGPPTVRGYEFPLEPNAPVDVLSVKCGTGGFGPRQMRDALDASLRRQVGTWFVLLPDGRLALRWFDETILLLQRAR